MISRTISAGFSAITAYQYTRRDKKGQRIYRCLKFKIAADKFMVFRKNLIHLRYILDEIAIHFFSKIKPEREIIQIIQKRRTTIQRESRKRQEKINKEIAGRRKSIKKKQAKRNRRR